MVAKLRKQGLLMCWQDTISLWLENFSVKQTAHFPPIHLILTMKDTSTTISRPGIGFTAAQENLNEI